MKYSYDEKCLDLARYFYPNQSIAFLEALAQAFQDCVEGREDTEMLPIPEFLRDQGNLRAERAEKETSVPAPEASIVKAFERSPRRVDGAHPSGSCLIGGDCDHVKETRTVLSHEPDCDCSDCRGQG